MALWTENRSLLALIDLARRLDAAPPASLADFTACVVPWMRGQGDMTALVHDVAAALAAEPLRELTIRGFAAGPMWGLALAETARAGVSLCLLDSLFPRFDPEPSLVFDDSFSLMLLLGGGAVAMDRFDCAEFGGPIIDQSDVDLQVGVPMLLHHAYSQVRLTAVERDAVLLRIGCTLPSAAPIALRYNVASGRPVQQLCADMAASRMMALIDIAADSQRPDRLALFGQLTGHPLPALRWQAARHWLVAETRGALPVITAMATDDADPGVRAAAQATVTMVETMLAREGAE